MIDVLGIGFVKGAHTFMCFRRCYIACSFVSSTRVKCVLPSLQLSGSSTVLSVRVSNNGLDYSVNELDFRAIPEEKITFVGPEEIDVSGGTVLSILGEICGLGLVVVPHMR